LKREGKQFSHLSKSGDNSICFISQVRGSFISAWFSWFWYSSLEWFRSLAPCIWATIQLFREYAG